MHPRRNSRARQLIGIKVKPSAVAHLRNIYFSQAGDSITRYGVSFDRVMRHLWEGRRTNRHLLLRSVAYIDDLVHGIACVDNLGLAWVDLSDRYERALIRRCRSKQDEIAATIFVRRLLAELRRRNSGLCIAQAPSLRCYSGNRPLRNWLADRLSAAMAHAAQNKHREHTGTVWLIARTPAVSDQSSAVSAMTVLSQTVAPIAAAAAVEVDSIADAVC